VGLEILQRERFNEFAPFLFLLSIVEEKEWEILIENTCRMV